MGARGNSGVILSQLWRGFARALDNLDNMDAQSLVRALAESRDTAYKGVVRPVEGTILTVAKDIAIEGEKAVNETEDLIEILERIVIAGEESVRRTPELLPILKQAGVVDSGGKGLFYILEGMIKQIRGETLETPTTEFQPIDSLKDLESHLDIEPGQDYEVVIDFKPYKPLDLETFYSDLSEMGTSIQFAEGDEFYRMHIHVPTDNRYQPIDYVMGSGTISKVFIENLMEQVPFPDQAQNEIECQEIEPGQIAVIAVSPGKGISKIFASLGVAAIVEGGQTMNPSTEEILKAFEDLPSDKVIILPNNKNIILASQAAKEMTVKQVEVIPSTSIPQGLSAMFRLIPDGDLDMIAKGMVDSLTDSESGEITTATRSVEINGVDVTEGEVIVLHNGKLIESSDNLEEACMQFLEAAEADDKEQLTLFYGNNISLEETNNIVAKIEENYPDLEIEVHEGGQPHYQFIISVE